MFSDRPLSEAVCTPDSDPREVCPYFEPDSYSIRPATNPPFVGVFGGPRGRLFQEQDPRDRGPMMKKVPLVKWARGFSYIYSTHSHRFVQLSDITGALLHFKFISTFSQVAAGESGRGDRRQLLDYAVYERTVEDRLSLFSERSCRYQGPRQLVGLGMMCASEAYRHHVERVLGARDPAMDRSDAALLAAQALPAPSQDVPPTSVRALPMIWPYVSNSAIGQHFGKRTPRSLDHRAALVDHLRRRVHVIRVAADHLLLRLDETVLHRWERSGLGLAVLVDDCEVRRLLIDGSDPGLSVDTSSLEPGTVRVELDLAAHVVPGLPGRVAVYVFDGVAERDAGAAGAAPTPAMDWLIHSQAWVTEGATTDGSGGFNGAIERVTEGALRGWVYDCENDRFDLQVAVFIDGRLVRVARANRRRRRLAGVRGRRPAGIGRGFRIPLPLGYFEEHGADTMTIEAFVAGTSIAITRSPLVLNRGDRYAEWLPEERSWRTAAQELPEISEPSGPPDLAAPRNGRRLVLGPIWQSLQRRRPNGAASGPPRGAASPGRDRTSPDSMPLR
ncbi:hypothetical protein [Nocardioides rotundus]|uniref:hypothetical protein n=1 Tax=Nocardioides rotundus TaxID=1774216 RepID=UPI001CBD23CF|nr:hypothetical protein [Nocardioides rotundus]